MAQQPSLPLQCQQGSHGKKGKHHQEPEDEDPMLMYWLEQEKEIEQEKQQQPLRPPHEDEEQKQQKLQEQRHRSHAEEKKEAASGQGASWGGIHGGGGDRDLEIGGLRGELQKQYQISNVGNIEVERGFSQKTIPKFSLDNEGRVSTAGDSSSNGGGGGCMAGAVRYPHQQYRLPHHVCEGISGAAANKWAQLGLPQNCVDLFRSRGISEPFDWQVECLCSDALRNGENLVYALPTSAGKTFVAEVTILKKMLRYKNYKRSRWDNSLQPCKSLIVFPYVSLCQEKKQEFEIFGDALGFLVEPFYDHMGKFPVPPRVNQLCIATIEKADRIVTSLLEEGRADELGLVIVDELHFIGENSRGCILEMLLTRLHNCFPKCQIVAMSATLPNVQDVKEWIKAESFDGSNLKRPVELLEHVVCGRELVHKKGRLIETLPETTVDDPDLLLHLVREGVAGERGEGNGSVLIFCPTVRETEAVAKRLQICFASAPCAASSRGGGHEPSLCFEDLDRIVRRRKEVVENLRSVKDGHGTRLLSSCVEQGIAFHNGTLLKEERKLIEDAFKCGVLKVLTATSTLAAGVNLPAGTVIITRPALGADLLRASTYKQMVGRAGRTGYEHGCGKSFLICKPNQRNLSEELMFDGPPEVRSQLMALPCRPQMPEKCQKTKPEGASDLTAQRAAKEYPDEFMKAVLSLVCMGRNPGRASADGRQQDSERPAGPLGCNGLEMANVQNLMRRTFFGVVWTRLAKELSQKDIKENPILSTIHIPPTSTLNKKLPGTSKGTDVETLDDVVEEVLWWLLEKQLIAKLPYLETSLEKNICDRNAAEMSGGSFARGVDTKNGVFRLFPTLLGRATYLSSLPIPTALEIYQLMSQGRTAGVVLVDQLHLLFMMTPIDQFASRFLTDDSFWNLLGRKWDKEFDENRKRVLDRIGLEYSYVQRRANKMISNKSQNWYEQDRKGKRLWLALIMQELVEEHPIEQVVARFSSPTSEDADSKKLTPHELEDLQSSGAMFSGKVAQFAQNVGYDDMSILFNHLISRIAYGARADITPLCEIPFVQVKRARKLHRQGYKTVEDIAGAKSSEIARILDLPEKTSKRIAEKVRLNFLYHSRMRVQSTPVHTVAHRSIHACTCTSDAHGCVESGTTSRKQSS